MPATVRDLTTDEMRQLLVRNNVGRLAYSFHDVVSIEPLHYVFADDVLYCRTSPGHKLATLEHHRWVAFEVDEIAGLFDWQSVVVHGSVYLVEEGPTPAAHETYVRTIARLRQLVPALYADDDPSPKRTVLFRIHVDRLTGKASSSSA